MSYILEALKKSEQEREQGGVPDIKSVHKPEIPGGGDVRGSWWLWLLAAVILVNSVVFAVVYFGDDESGNAAGHDQQPALAQRPAAESIDKAPPPRQSASPSAAAAAPSRASAPPRPDPVVEQPRSQVVFSDKPLQLDDTLGNTAAAEKVQGKTSVTNQTPDDELPAGTVSELPEAVRKQIPAIEFGGHVYSSKVKRRSVMINGKRMREGDAVGSGLLLSKITPQGAEFEFQGYRFRLNALQDWSYR